MAMKQTQTKFYDFSDVGLDFSAGSKALFPDRFKKMLALGYNPQTASSASITGNQVTLTYGVTHGYVADRVLQVTAAGGYNKEVYIDSVTSSTVTFTDATATGLTGLISTKVAPLGWELMYEVANIHVYKFKQLDESDVFMRVVFQDNLTQRNRLGICIGKTANLTAGTITDAGTMQSYATTTTPNQPFALEFGGTASSAANNYTYADGASTYQKWIVVGSKYHCIFSGNIGQANFGNRFNAILPFLSVGYEQLNYPLIIGEVSTQLLTSNNFGDGQNEGGRGYAYAGKYRVCLREYAASIPSGAREQLLGLAPQSISNYLPSSIDSFDTTTSKPISAYEYDTWQFIGVVAGGAYHVNYSSSAPPDKTTLPLKTSDITLNSNVYLCGIAGTSGNNIYLALPIEEIKIA